MAKTSNPCVHCGAPTPTRHRTVCDRCLSAKANKNIRGGGRPRSLKALDARVEGLIRMVRAEYEDELNKRNKEAKP